MKKHILFLPILLLFACELIVDVKVPHKQAQLTVNSIFNPDSVWLVNVSLNQYILNNNIQFVDNALVVIYHDGSPIDTLIHQEYVMVGNYKMHENGMYRSDTGKPLIGAEYEIRVSAENYETVISQSKIPFICPQITQVEIIPGDNTVGGVPTTININFKDNLSETNYYQILVEEEHEYVRSGSVIAERYPVDIESNDPGQATESDDTNPGDGVFMKDILFNGKDVKLSFKTTFSLNDDSPLIITLRTVSEEYYKYKTTLQLQNSTSGDPFAQPVNVYNNIQHGFGIFAGYSQSIFIKGKPRPIITGINPLAGRPGDHIIISGENFFPGYVSVLFSGNMPTFVRTVRSTENEIEVIIPNGAVTGKIFVFTGGRVAISDADFVVLN